MKKSILIAASLISILGVSLAANNFNSNNREFSELELANIEALTDDEGTPVKPCYRYSNISGDDYGWHNDFCNQKTSKDMIYPCSDNMLLGYRAQLTNCIKK